MIKIILWTVITAPATGALVGACETTESYRLVFLTAGVCSGIYLIFSAVEDFLNIKVKDLGEKKKDSFLDNVKIIDAAISSGEIKLESISPRIAALSAEEKMLRERLEELKRELGE